MNKKEKIKAGIIGSAFALLALVGFGYWYKSKLPEAQKALKASLGFVSDNTFRTIGETGIVSQSYPSHTLGFDSDSTKQGLVRESKPNRTEGLVTTYNHSFSAIDDSYIHDV